MWILVGGPCGRTVHDGERARTRGNGRYAQETPPEPRVNAPYAIGIVPYWPDHGLRARADVVYTREIDGYRRDREPYGPDYDRRTLDDVVSRARNARRAPACRLNGAAIACSADVSSADSRPEGLRYTQSKSALGGPVMASCGPAAGS